MNTGRFIIYACIYIILVGLIAYFFVPTEFNFQAFEYSLSLPVAVWLVLPAAILAVFATLHMLYASFLIYRFKASLKQDRTNLKTLIKSLLLANSFDKSFTNEGAKLAASALKSLAPYPKAGASIDDEELEALHKLYLSIKNGEVADIKKYHLDPQNPLFIQNELNKINSLPNYYLEILKSAQSYPESLQNAAYAKLLELGDYQNIRKYFLAKKDFASTYKLLKRFVDDELKLNPDEIDELLNNDKFKAADFSELAILLTPKLAPEQIHALFLKLKESFSEAEQAYLYVLFELSMLDEAREILQNSADGEYSGFKTLLFLRDSSKRAPTQLFLDDRF